jgi:solute carrier family 40 (iron-regulated transporter), member 1
MRAEERGQPFGNGLLLYAMHFCFAFVSRMWQIGIVLLVAELTQNSLYFIALSGLLSSSSVFFFSSPLGQLFDQYDRLTCITIALFLKLVSVSLGYALCAEMLSLSLPLAEILNSYQIYSIPIICAIADLSFSMITMGLEKDWVVVLSNGNSDWLSKTNSIMTQIDLACNAIAPIAAGILFSFFSYGFVALILLSINAAASFGLYIFLQRLYHSWEALSVKSLPVDPSMITADDVAIDGVSPLSYNSPLLHPDRASSAKPPRAMASVAPSPTLLTSGCAGAMIAYSLLYLTVLSFGSLMLVYLKWCGVPDHWIGISRGLAALSGFTGAWLYPIASQSLGLTFVAKISIWWQSCLVLIAALGLIFTSRQVGSMIMIVAVVTTVLSPPLALLTFFFSAPVSCWFVVLRPLHSTNRSGNDRRGSSWSHQRQMELAHGLL